MIKNWKLYLWFGVLFCLAVAIFLVGGMAEESSDQLLELEAKKQDKISMERTQDDMQGILPAEFGQTVLEMAEVDVENEVEEVKNEVKNKIEDEVEDLVSDEPDLVLLAYQLERELRAQYQTAYESYINLENLVKKDQTKFDQIIAFYREGIQPIAVETQVKKQINRLEDFYRVGEREATFPIHEVVENAKVLMKNDNRAQVALTLTKYFSEQKRSDKTYGQTFNYLIDLVKEDNRWKIEEISNEF